MKERRTRKGEPEQEGLKRLITGVWKQWCETSGTPFDKCPMHRLAWHTLED